LTVYAGRFHRGENGIARFGPKRVKRGNLEIKDQTGRLALLLALGITLFMSASYGQGEKAKPESYGNQYIKAVNVRPLK
jgi:hypothetical protein